MAVELPDAEVGGADADEGEDAPALVYALGDLPAGLVYTIMTGLRGRFRARPKPPPRRPSRSFTTQATARTPRV